MDDSKNNSNHISRIICDKNDDKSLEVKNRIVRLTSFREESLRLDGTKRVICIIGGDSTILRVFHSNIEYFERLYFFTIKTGTAGFYTFFNPLEIDDINRLTMSKNPPIISLSPISAKVEEDNLIIFALNEIKIISRRRTAMFRVMIGDNLLYETKATGIVISTNQGSTGFIKTVDGAVVVCKTNLMQLKEISPVGNKFYEFLGNSVIVDGENEIGITVSDRGRQYYVEMIADNTRRVSFKSLVSKNIRVKISNSKKMNFFVRPGEKDDWQLKKVRKIFIKNIVFG